MQVSWAALAWSLNFFVIWLLVRMMMLGVPPPSLDLLAYSGYSFFSFCLTTLCGWAFGSGLGWHIAWLYTSTCMSVFLIRTFKQIMRIDAANRGEANVGTGSSRLMSAFHMWYLRTPCLTFSLCMQGDTACISCLEWVQLSLLYPGLWELLCM